MNPPFGSLDHLSDWSWYDADWTTSSSAENERGFEDDGFLTSTGNFNQTGDIWQSASWPDVRAIPPYATQSHPRSQQYDFGQTEQVWYVANNELGHAPRAPTTTDNRVPGLSDTMPPTHNCATTAMQPPAGLGITVADQCTYLGDTTVDQVSVSPEVLQALFPSPVLPRQDPSSLRDEDGQPLQKQKPRFEGDLYAALWIRGEGVSRAGFCGFCATWHRLKDSAYWYHLHYSHGIWCNTGRPLERPTGLRWNRGANVCEAHCASCREWVSIGKGNKMATTYWRHAYKCLSRGAAARGRSPRTGTAVPDLSHSAN